MYHFQKHTYTTHTHTLCVDVLKEINNKKLRTLKLFLGHVFRPSSFHNDLTKKAIPKEEYIQDKPLKINSVPLKYYLKVHIGKKILFKFSIKNQEEYFNPIFLKNDHR